MTRKMSNRINGSGLFPAMAKPTYLYTFATHETELELCRMELRALFGHEPDGADWLESDTWIDPDRSPFVTACVEVIAADSSIERLAERAAGIPLNGGTFKVIALQAGNHQSYEELRAMERIVGGSMKGRADMKTPEHRFGLLSVQGGWKLGLLHLPRRAWHQHKQKPQNYSTGLTSRLARALVNIAAPDPRAKLLDPCCGMGNVLIEALSMGIRCEGCDINPLAVRGARVNLAHYGYDDSIVAIRDMNTLEGHFETAVLDLPYNVCSVFPEEDQRRMLNSLRRLADRAVIVSTEPLAEQLEQAGWQVLSSCTTRKGTFERSIWLCE